MFSTCHISFWPLGGASSLRTSGTDQGPAARETYGINITPESSMKSCDLIHYSTDFCFSHLFVLFSGVLWYLATSFWFPGETACILWTASKKRKERKAGQFQSKYRVLTNKDLQFVFPGCSPLAWSLSSWLAVFFHSSIRSWSGVTRPSIRALQRTREHSMRGEGERK